MTNHFNDIAYYRNLDPLILYGDTWLYGAALPTANIGIPTDVYVLHERDYNIISWKNSVKDGIKGYYIYRSKTVGHADTELIAMIFNKDDSNEVYTCYVDYLSETEKDTQFYYAIASINNGDFVSGRSDWAADINLDNSFTSIKYLYTNQLTQTYWTIIDLYKQLGNIDTDRNIIPFRDLGNTYTQTLTNVGYPKMYLKNELSVDDGYLNNSNTAVPGYLRNDVRSLEPKNIPVKADCNYLYVTTLPTSDIKTYTFYMDNIPMVSNKSAVTITASIYEDDTNNNLSNLKVDKIIFASKVDESGIYNFYWNSIYNHWQTETEDVNLDEYGITFEGEPQIYNKISVEFNKVGYVYFRIPYIYDSKILQTYIKSNDEIKKYNEFSFKTYNHLIFASTLGKIFNDLQIQLKVSKGNLYTSDVSDSSVYKNFASYFNFEQPAWLKNVNYRNCVLGNNETGAAGLWQAAMIGGTQLSIQQAVEALASGNFTITSLTDLDYLTCYDSCKSIEGTGLNLTEILPYEPNTTYSVNDVVFYNDSYYQFTSNIQQQLNVNTSYVKDDLVLYNDNYYWCLSDHISPNEIDDTYLSQYWCTDIFTSTNNSALECVNKEYKNAVFKKAYDNDTTSVSYDPLTIKILTDTETITCNKYDLIYVNSIYYEVRKQFNYFYNILKFSDFEPNPLGIAEDSFYYNTQTKKLYKIDNGVWVESAADLKLDALYFNSDNKVLYVYDGTELINQNILRSVDKICDTIRLSIPLNLDAIYELIGTEYYLTNLQLPVIEKDYIFKGEYLTDADTDPISYTRSYIINTYRIEFDNWKRSIDAEKYLVYGNKIQLNNKNIIYPNSYFAVYTDVALTDEIPSIAYTINKKDGILIWQDSQFKPADGSYIYISYIVDIRPDIKKLIELFKFPQVNIEYVWIEKQEE